MGLLPSDPDVSTDAGPRVVGLDSADADALVSALTSETARRILTTLHEEPAPPSEVADRVDTSLQNAQYHLRRLEDAGAVEVAGTAYSEKGREMDVFAPADSPLVIVAGEQEASTGIRSALRRLLGGVGVLALGSLLVQQLAGESVLPMAQTGGADGGEATTHDLAAGTDAPGAASGGGTGGTPTPTPESGGTMDAGTATPAPEATGTAAPTATPTPAPTPEPVTTEAATAIAGGDPGLALGTLPPGVLFFLGGLTVLLVGLALTATR